MNALRRSAWAIALTGFSSIGPAHAAIAPNVPVGVTRELSKFGGPSDTGVPFAFLPNGDVVAAYAEQSSDVDGVPDYDVYIELMDATGRVKPNSRQRVNVTTTYWHIEPVVATSSDGDFVVAWQQQVFFPPNSPGATKAVYSRAYHADGTPRAGGEQRVNVPVTFGNRQPSVAVAADGHFVVAWQYSVDDRNDPVIYTRAFDPDGNPASGTQQRVSGSPNDDAPRPTVTMADDGDYVVQWRDRGIVHTRAYAADGTAKAGGHRKSFDQETCSGGVSASVAMNASGRFVLVWSCNEESWVRPFDADGMPLTTARKFTDRALLLPGTTAGIAPDGSYGVFWKHRAGRFLPDFIQHRLFDPQGQMVVGTTLSSPDTAPEQTNPAVAVKADGSYLLAWEVDDRNVVARAFDAAGAPTSPVSVPFDDLTDPGVALESLHADADGDTWALWSRQGMRRLTRIASAEPVDLRIVAKPATVGAEAGAAFRYRLRVRNAHVATANPNVGLADGVTVTTTLPAGVAFSDAGGEGWMCGAQGRDVTCRLRPALVAAAYSILAIDATAAAVGDYPTTFAVTGQQFDPDEAIGTTNTVIVPVTVE